MSLLDKGIKRRDFLRVSAGAAAAAAAFSATSAGKSYADDAHAGYDEVSHDADIVNQSGEWVPIHCHQNCNQMCQNMGFVVDGVVVRLKTDDWHEDSFDCPQQRSCLRGRSLRQGELDIVRACWINDPRVMDCAQPRITSTLCDSTGASAAYEHFSPPFILQADRVLDQLGVYGEREPHARVLGFRFVAP